MRIAAECRRELMRFRIERDPLGELNVPADAYYGVQTARAVENFPISGLRAPADLVTATILDQESRGRSQRRARPARRRRRATRSSPPPTRSSPAQLRDQFVVDVYQAGAGTSHNMNANEVLANRAGEILGEPRGTYTRVHPNDHVNMGQSTNDVFPTATRLALLLGARAARRRRARRSPTASRARPTSSPTCSRPAARTCRTPCRSRSARNSAATPRASRRGADDVARGGGAAARAEHRRDRGRHRAERRRRLPAAGRRATSRATPACRCRPAANLFRVTQSMGDVLAYSGAMRRLAVELGKIASDLRLLSMGPRAGLVGDRAAGGAARLVDHAGQGESVDAGDGQPGLLPGDGLRHDGRDRLRGRAARAERDDAGDRVERAARVDDPARGDEGAARRAASTASPPTRRARASCSIAAPRRRRRSARTSATRRRRRSRRNR